MYVCTYVRVYVWTDVRIYVVYGDTSVSLGRGALLIEEVLKINFALSVRYREAIIFLYSASLGCRYVIFYR